MTGGGSGIGRATCERLLADGFTLAVLDIDGDTAKAAAGSGGVGLAVDVSEAEQVERAFATIVESFGRIDVLVNNAGVTGGAAATVCHETSVEDWDRVQAINSRGPFLCSRAALPVMIAQGGGHVITTASVAGQIVFPGRCAYTASKGAALMFAKSLAVDYAKAGIRSNAVCPGFVETPMTQWRLDVPELRSKVESNIPMGRVAQPDDIADAIALLASGRLGYMTGHALVVDGGWTSL
ncbi:SDR family NAD(P)-dependent oxidoreductase [Pseudonocardia sp. GCM10023141]|uniref:SDR family NAD(P)-dependent oxidoreductase n=1 Tax=Pseudonocardia sp. GCM10023141 TaxID=3252653 RepID=UPI00360D56E3